MSSENQDTERRLIEACLGGDSSAFEQIYKQLSEKMYMVSLRYTQNDSDAQDVLQEAFIRIYKNLNRFKFQGSFEGWCRRIVVNSSIELIRKRNRHQFDDIEQTEAIALDPKSISKLTMQELLGLIRQLPDGYRTVFNMYVIEGYSHKEIGETLGISENTSKTQLFKARQALQKKLTNQEV
ncbi:MAG: RNA polymerase sigma factor [Bacteroidetes bacterium]|nr:RNA polymerase sigma factor [Bacteroidota bacterium]